MFLTLLIVSLFYTTQFPVAKAQCTPYSYINGQNGPTDWPTSCPTCAGTAQSPIDIDPSTTSTVKSWLPLQLIHYEVDPYKMYIKNTGHTAQVTYEADDCTHIPTVIQGNLIGQAYQLEQFHFHWGSNGNPGSEHTYKGKHFDAELHFVHYNIECGDSLSQAVANCPDPADGAAAVLTVWIKEGGEDNHNYKSIIEGLKKIKASGDKVEIEPMDMTKLMPYNLDEFYRYMGGLTTPACNEIVTFTIFKEYVKLSRRQLEQFYQLTTLDGSTDSNPIPLIDTFRPVQPLNGRTVYYADLKLRPHHNDWESAPYCGIYYKESNGDHDFLGAVDFCTSHYWSKTPIQGLIPVRKLRCIRNRFRSMSTDDIDGRFFRVNAVKDNEGVWREYNSNRRILFHQFPEFDPNHGSSGDTLVWDAFLNRLFIQHQDDQYKAMCYRDYMNDCEDCTGAETGNLCSNAGECVEDVCQCDDKFSWHGCQLGPAIPGQEVVHVGGAASQMFYSGVANQGVGATDTYCLTTSNYATVSGTSTDQVCDYVFGRGICCLGLTTADSTVATDTCFYWDCFSRSWMATNNVPAKLTSAAANPIRQDGRDEYWIIAGGLVDGTAGSDSQAIYAMDDDMMWQTKGQLPWTRKDHCQVQISDCEVAFIGGTKDGTPSSADIDIWNFKENTWRSGPAMITGDTNPACGLIHERHDFSRKVVMGCGDAGTVAEVWEVDSHLVYASAHACPGDDDGDTVDEPGHFKELDNNYHDHEDFNTNQLVFTNAENRVYVFDLYNGFKETYTIGDSDGGDAFVAPRGTVGAGTDACTAP